MGVIGTVGVTCDYNTLVVSKATYDDKARRCNSLGREAIYRLEEVSFLLQKQTLDKVPEWCVFSAKSVL